MADVMRPEHFFFVLMILLILFGPGNLSTLGRGLGRMHSELRGERSRLRGALFMAKGVDPGVGRDVGDMLPDEEASRSMIWTRILVAIVLGNLLYFLSLPLLPRAASLTGERLSAVPALVDIWFCLLVFGVLGFLRPPNHL